MRIYLSSYRLGTHADALVTTGGRAAVVVNALDPYPPRIRSWAREARVLEPLGYSCDELDLRDYWGDAEALAQRLDGVDLLWVVGGNAFVLARAATAAGLADALRRTSGLTYGGYSAGACLTSVDLTGMERLDPPDDVPPGYTADMPATTLNLTGTRIIPHAGTRASTEAEEALRAAGLSCTPLADGEDLLLVG